jgi:hypothetical protein
MTVSAILFQPLGNTPVRTFPVVVSRRPTADGGATPRVHSLRAERDHRIDPHRAPRGEEAGGQR